VNWHYILCPWNERLVHHSGTGFKNHKLRRDRVVLWSHELSLAPLCICDNAWTPMVVYKLLCASIEKTLRFLKFWSLRCNELPTANHQRHKTCRFFRTPSIMAFRICHERIFDMTFFLEIFGKRLFLNTFTHTHTLHPSDDHVVLRSQSVKVIAAALNRSGATGNLVGTVRARIA